MRRLMRPKNALRSELVGDQVISTNYAVVAVEDDMLMITIMDSEGNLVEK